MSGRRGAMEATQDQLAVCVVPYVPDCYALEQTTFCAQDVVSPGAHLPPPTEHAPHLPVPQPRLTLWEEMGAHVLQTCGSEFHSDLFVTHVLFWRHQFGIEVFGHQQLCPTGPLAEAATAASMAEASSGAV